MIPLILCVLISSFSDAGLHFLLRPPGARQVAMGHAFTGIADDVTAVYYNPGGLGLCEAASAGFMNSLWLPGLAQIGHRALGKPDVYRGPAWLPGLHPGMRHLYIAGMVPVSPLIGAFGVSYNYSNTGESIGIDENGNQIALWETYDCALTVSYARKISRRIGLGASVKYIYSFLSPDDITWIIFRKHGGTATSVAYDFGMLYKASIQGLSAGISAQNLGFRGMRYIEGEPETPLPALIRGGIGFASASAFRDLIPEFVSDLTFAVDWMIDMVGEDRDNLFCGGTEITFKDAVSLRSGYLYGEPDRRGLTWGLGLKFGGMQLDLANDGALYPSCSHNYRIQINMEPFNARKRSTIGKTNRGLDILLAGVSSVVIPGGGQFYKAHQGLVWTPPICCGMLLA